MIDRERKLIFLHIPKTGGSSIESLLSGSDEVGDHRQLDSEVLTGDGLSRYFPLMRHATLREYEELLTSEGDDPSSYRVFTLIRDPRDILRSTYRFRLSNYRLRREVLGVFARLRFRLEHSSFSVFLLFLLLRSLAGGAHMESLSTFVASDRGTTVKVFRLEDVSANAEALYSWLDLPPSGSGRLAHKNVTGDKRPLNSILLRTAARVVFADIDAHYA